MRKRWISALLALVLTAVLLPAPAQAAAADASAGSRLTGADREVYDYLKAEIVKVAQGARTSTEFRIPDLDSLSWSLKELDAAGDGRSDVLAKLEKRFGQSLHIRRVYDCLAADLPFDLFWKGNQYSWDFAQTRQGDRAFIRNLTIHFQVSQDYRGSGEHRVDPAKIAAAGRAADNARAIVAKHADKSDYGKLTAYREEICALTAYDMGALDGAVPYGDPWQAVAVFDGDKDTNVVCEGYAKAFKYLCDLSDFDGDVACYLVSGTMGGGDHMWNVVRMEDGRYYLADLTNCDTGMIGAEDKLFLAGASGSERTWTVDRKGIQVSYTYDEGEKGLYTEGWPALSAGDYVEPEPGSAAADPSVNGSSPFRDVLPEAYYAQAVDWAVGEAITNGTSADSFSPGRTCTHAEILTFLWRAAGEPASYGDASLALGGEYYAPAVRWAQELDMLEPGFDPQAGCARSDAVRYLWCAFDRPDSGAERFDDVPDSAPYAQAVGWAVEEKITNGTSADSFSPRQLCDRGQIVTFLYRAYQ